MSLDAWSAVYARCIDYPEQIRKKLGSRAGGGSMPALHSRIAAMISPTVRDAPGKRFFRRWRGTRPGVRRGIVAASSRRARHAAGAGPGNIRAAQAAQRGPWIAIAFTSKGRFVTNSVDIDILIVEDEPKLALVVVDFMRAAGFAPRWIADGLAVEAAIAQRMPHLIILDLRLPGKDGRDICRDLRKHSDVPVIMVTAQVDEIDRLLGLEIGADDYVCKPFSPLELVARVKAILRRTRIHAHPETSPLQLDEAKLQASYQGVTLDLTPIEFRLLATLASRPAQVFSRNLLIDRLYTDGRVVEDRTVDSHVRKIRRKLEAIAPGEDIVQSVYGAGFKLVL